MATYRQQELEDAALVAGAALVAVVERELEVLLSLTVLLLHDRHAAQVVPAQRACWEPARRLRIAQTGAAKHLEPALNVSCIASVECMMCEL